jgi:hypothetical protein
MQPKSEENAKPPTPSPASPPLNSADTVAPEGNMPQSDLVLRRLEELLKNNQVTPELEKESGMSREQMEQFVTKFKKAPKAAPGPGRQIQVKPGKDRVFNPNRKLPDLGPNAHVGNRTGRGRGATVQDQIRDNTEGGRFEIPPELRSGFEAYKSSLSRSKSAARPAASGSGGR